MTDKPLTKNIDKYPSGADIVGRCSLDIDQRPNINNILSTNLNRTRSRGQEFWNGRDDKDPSKWNGETYTRKTFTMYMMELCDRIFDTLPVVFRGIWHQNVMFITMILRNCFENDDDTLKKFCVKGNDLSLNWAADMDKILNLGPSGWFFVLSKDSLRAFINYLYESIAQKENFYDSYIAYMEKATEIILSSNGTLKFTPLQSLLLAIDSYNAEISSIYARLPYDVVIKSGFLDGVRYSVFYKDEIIAAWGQQAQDYFDNIFPLLGI